MKNGGALALVVFLEGLRETMFSPFTNIPSRSTALFQHA